MHLPDGVLPAGEWVPLLAAGGTVFAVASTRVRSAVDARRIPTIGLLAAVILVLQLVNFPLIGGASGHITGTTLLVFVAGVEIAAVAMASVLTLQALLFQDGGLLALGANYVNMVVVPALIAVAFVRFAGPRATPERRAVVAGISAWFGCIAGALSCALQLSLAGVAPARAAMVWMGGCHALIGLAEGVLTAAAFGALARRGVVPFPADETRPSRNDTQNTPRGWLVPVLVVGAVAGLLLPIASQRPDVLETLLRQSTSAAMSLAH